MTINYVGRNNEFFENETPIAVISYDASKEGEKADTLFDLIKDYGWEVSAEDESIIVELSDHSEYLNFKKEYLQCKKQI